MKFEFTLSDNDCSNYKINSHLGKSTKDIKKWCGSVGVQEQRLHEMVRLRSQLVDLLKTNKFFYDNCLKSSKRTISLNKRAYNKFAFQRCRYLKKTKKSCILNVSDTVSLCVRTVTFTLWLYIYIYNVDYI